MIQPRITKAGTSLNMRKLVAKHNPGNTEDDDKKRKVVSKWEDNDDDTYITGKDFKESKMKLPVLKSPMAQHSHPKLRDPSPTKTQDHGKGPTFATRGGGVAYHNVRSKIAKYDSGEPKVVTVEREKMMQKLGKDPGYNVVAMHKTGGSHVGHGGDPFTIGTRAQNTSDSNKAREKAAKKPSASAKFNRKFG